jgi:hypothetical protein
MEFLLNEYYLALEEFEELSFSFGGLFVRLEGSMESVELIFNLCAVSFKTVVFPA